GALSRRLQALPAFPECLERLVVAQGVATQREDRLGPLLSPELFRPLGPLVQQEDCKVHFVCYPVDLTQQGSFALGRTPLSAAPAATLLASLQRLTDPRCRRGVRHPFAAVLALTFLGLLCRPTDFAPLARCAKAHWAALRPALGFTRRYAPHATTLTRVAAL